MGDEIRPEVQNDKRLEPIIVSNADLKAIDGDMRNELRIEKLLRSGKTIEGHVLRRARDPRGSIGCTRRAHYMWNISVICGRTNTVYTVYMREDHPLDKTLLPYGRNRATGYNGTENGARASLAKALSYMERHA